MDVDLQFSRMTVREGNRSFGQRVRYVSLETYHRSGLAPSLSFSCSLILPGQYELLIHSQVYPLLAENADLFNTRTYVLREMLQSSGSACDELMLLLAMVDALIHRRTCLAGPEGSSQGWMSVL
ncbi:hypothetical protein BGZ93_004935 [Podila epicladia]|nr:hypothetical protein BGZ93_004935 [Podila epicladia]